nr:hypothetical protein [Tanacetum cinerariifolium]
MKPTTDGRWAHLACAMWILGPLEAFIIYGVPYGACIQSAASDYGTLALSISDIHWTDNFQEDEYDGLCTEQDMLRPIHVALVSCSRRFQKGENQEREDETDIDVDDTNGRRLSWHSDMDNGL